MNIQHSSRNDDWETPKSIVNLVHQVIGYPDLDPASSLKANQVVKAKRFFTKEDDALKTTWATEPVSIYLNSPGGKLGNKGLTALFWDELMHYHELGLIKEAIFMCFSLEALQTSQVYPRRPITDFLVCIPKNRIAFVDPLGQGRVQPSHSNAIVYVPGLIDSSDKFCEVFKGLGGLMKPV